MTTPFRWDLVKPDQLGSLLDNTKEPDLWFADTLAECAGKVLARSDNGDIVFVGRSLDSMYDLLSGALSNVEQAPELSRLPFSFSRSNKHLTPEETKYARGVLEANGWTPYSLARRSNPVTFVDVVSGGSTFGELYRLLRAWIEAEKEDWNVIKRKLRFVGVTWQQRTSPNTWRWTQENEWVSELPKKATISVSIEGDVWHYLGNIQVKLTRTHAPRHWIVDDLDEEENETVSDFTRNALAEAVALVSYGRTHSCRKLVVKSFQKEPTLSESWLRTLQANILK